MNNYQVPVLSIIFMCVSLVFSVAFPIALFMYFKKRHEADTPPFFIGCAVMLLFALVLESVVHSLVLGSPAGNTIVNNTLLYALYGGLMAGIFEETGRFLAFKTVMGRYRHNDANALMYGAGHGSLEVLALLGLTMITNITFSLMLNGGGAAEALRGMSAADAASMEEIFASLTGSAPYIFLMGIIERVFAVVLQISLSVIVWFSVKRSGRLYLYPTAIGIHAAVDAVTAVLSRSAVPTVVTEIVIGVMAAAVAFFAFKIWIENGDRRGKRPGQAAEQ